MKNHSTLSPPVYAFVITKPLQLMVVMAIIEQLPAEIIKELLVVDVFFDAKKITAVLGEAKYKWKSAVFFQDKISAFRYCRGRKYNSVFLDSDVGSRNNIDLIALKLHSPQTILAVYEEGLGTYRNDLYRGLKKKILSALGIGVYFGGNWLTQKLYLYSPDEYKKKIGKETCELVRIETPIPELIKNNEALIDRLFEIYALKSQIISRRDVSNESCDIYLSGWNIDSKVVDSFPAIDSFRILKPHPHIKKIPERIWSQFEIVVSPSVPAEMLITVASFLFAEVRVLHHGSSVMRYVSIENVKFRCVV